LVDRPMARAPHAAEAYAVEEEGEAVGAGDPRFRRVAT
jgi:hypothetical protein